MGHKFYDLYFSMEAVHSANIELLLEALLQLKNISIVSLFQKLPQHHRVHAIPQFLKYVTGFPSNEQQELLSFLWTNYRTTISKKNYLSLFLSALPSIIPKTEIEKLLNESASNFHGNPLAHFGVVRWMYRHNGTITAEKFHQNLQRYKEELLLFSSEIIKETARTYLWGNNWFEKRGCQLNYRQYPAYIRSKIKAVVSLTLIQNFTTDCQFRRLPKDVLYHILDELLEKEQLSFSLETAPISFDVKLMLYSHLAEKCVMLYLFG